MSGHTPGPWCVHPVFSDWVIVASDAHKKIGASSDPDREAEGWAKHICRADHSEYSDFHRSRIVSKREMQANAHLIAAAPEMKEVLRAARMWVALYHAHIASDPVTHPDAIENIKADRAAIDAAIAKAEGRQS